MSQGRPGRSRLHYFYEAKLDQIAQFLDKLVMEKDKKLIQMPHVLTSSGAGAVLNFAGVTEPEQMVFDLRGESERDLAFKGERKNTFKTEIEMFDERPELKYVEKTSGQVWYGSIHLIEKPD